MRKDVGRANVLYVHVTLLPALAATGELKTKPTQHSVKELRGIGIQPDVIVLRSDHPVPDEIREKIALFTDVATDAVIPAETADTIYEVPLHVRGGRSRPARRPRARPRRPGRRARTSTAWRALVARIKAPKPILEIALVGKYIELPDAYLSVTEALRHAAWAHEVDAKVRWVDSEALTHENLHDRLDGVAGILVPGGFGHRGIEGKVLAAHFARDHRIPYLGLCLGLQCAVIEFAREVVGTADANSTEFDMFTEQPGHRLHARPARHGGQGRHDAPRPLPGQADARLEGRRGLRPGGHLRAASPPLRGEQPLSPDARGGRHDAVRPVARRPARRDRRAQGPPVVRGQPVPPGVQVAGPSGRIRCSTGSWPRRSRSATGASRSSRASRPIPDGRRAIAAGTASDVVESVPSA